MPRKRCVFLENATFVCYIISSDSLNSSMSHPPPQRYSSSSSSVSRRSSFSWGTSRSFRSDQNDHDRLRESLNASELELSSIIDTILDNSSSPLIDFDSQRSPSMTGSIRGVKPEMPAALRRRYSETETNRLRMTRENQTLHTMVSGMDIVRTNNGTLSRRDSDAQTV